ncbi:MAG: hypothetical protein HC889_20490 [Synechococcaceae cyanobacterium SM1_2_3]|nr:hypothetical protein [Synechococcaceae cyanobacterium SM1_2_3]
MPTQVYVPQPHGSGYTEATLLGATAHLEPTDPTIDHRFTCRVLVEPSGHAIRVDVLGSAGGQYAIAKNHYAANSWDAVGPSIDYDEFVFLVSVENDAHCQGVYPPDSQLPSDTLIFKNLIYVGNQYHKDRILPDTVVALVDAAMEKTLGTSLRDDTPTLEK